MNFKQIVLAAYDGLRPQLAEKIKDTKSKWDDAALLAVDTLVDTFLRKK